MNIVVLSKYSYMKYILKNILLETDPSLGINSSRGENEKVFHYL